MLDAVSQLGILLLLLITGMETDVSVFRSAGRPAVGVSLGGIVVPFLCGCLLGTLLPESMLPHPARRVITTLFLGTALSISSVKIVALVIRDLGFLRRTVGQVIIAASILDDTVGWIVMSVTFGLALQGAIDLGGVAHSVLGVALFLVLSLTFGRRLVFSILRWSNDTLASEMANITTIVVVTGLLALLTNALGVHLVLGAFVAGLLLGQSPMLSRQLNAQLRGLIIGLFMPVFFTLVGLMIDLAALAQPRFLWLALALIALASIGKFLGAFIGGRFGGLTHAESFAVGCGMNARGSTEVIVASIGLQAGALTQQLFTAIVAMAVVTTMLMPAMLRWAFSRLPLSDAERARLEREEFEARGFLPRIDRLLVAVDSSPSGRFASNVAGLLAAARRTPTTVLQLDAPRADDDARRGERADGAGELVKAAAAAGAEAAAASGVAPHLTRTIQGFPGPFAIAIARGEHRESAAGPLHVLVTVSGTRVSRQGAEVAIALAHASRGSVTALHVSAARGMGVWRLRFGDALAPRGYPEAVIREIVEMGEHYGIEVRREIRQSGTVRGAVLRELARERHNLLVMGVSPRPGGQLFLGELSAEVLARAGSSLLFVCGEPPPGAAAS